VLSQPRKHAGYQEASIPTGRILAVWARGNPHSSVGQVWLHLAVAGLFKTDEAR
jgi:hypothetical protein